jgi:uncharacterized protein
MFLRLFDNKITKYLEFEPNFHRKEEGKMAKCNASTFSFRINDFFHLFINTTSGAIDIVPERVAKGVMSKDERRLLIQRGYIGSQRETDNMKLLHEASLKHRENMPYWFYLLTTLNCNFACPICYERKILGGGEISPEVLNGSLAAIKGLQEKWAIPQSRMNLVLFGGEPLLVSNPNILREALQFAQQNGWKCVIITNGSKAKSFSRLFDEFRKVISDFRITVDGPPRIHDSRRPYKSGKGSWEDVMAAIENILLSGHQVKMQTILGAGNIKKMEALLTIIQQKGWLEFPNFQWRIEGSHDYTNLTNATDEYSEAAMVKMLVELFLKYPQLKGKMKFESFKYLAHLTNSFGWLGKYKTYWGPKFSFCEPQKGFQYIFSVDGKIYHCPRTIGNSDFCVGDIEQGLNTRDNELKRRSMLERDKCKSCVVNTLCGGGCPVQEKNFPKIECEYAALFRIHSFIELLRDRILEQAMPNRITSVSELWLPGK